MEDTKSLEQIAREFEIKTLLERNKCIIQISPDAHVSFCMYHKTKYCKIEYSQKCNYAVIQDRHD